MMILSDKDVQSLIDIDELIAVLTEVSSLASRVWSLELTLNPGLTIRDRAEAR